MATAASLLPFLSSRSVLGYSAAFSNRDLWDGPVPRIVEDSVQLVYETIRAKELTVTMNGERIDDIRQLLYFTAKQMIGELTPLQMNIEASMQRNLFSLTANQAAHWYGNTDKKTENGDLPLFYPEASTLVTHRQTLRKLRDGTGVDIEGYLRGFAPNAVYATTEKEAVIGYQAIHDSNIKNLAMAPALSYPVLALIASGNQGNYILNNQLKNGAVFNMYSVNAVNSDGLYALKIDNYNVLPATLQVLKYMFFHPLETLSRMRGCSKTEKPATSEVPLTPEPLSYSYNASALASRAFINEAFPERSVTLSRGGEILTPEQFLQELESVADALSGEPLDESLKTFQAQIQLNQQALTGNVAAKHFAQTKLQAIKGDLPLFDIKAVSLAHLGSVYNFLGANSDQSKSASLVEMMDENAIYVEAGHYATTGKESIASYFAKHPLKTHAAQIEVDSYTIEKNMMTATQTFTLADGEKFKVCYVAYFNNEGKITFLEEIYNRAAVRSEMFCDSLRRLDN